MVESYREWKGASLVVWEDGELRQTEPGDPNAIDRALGMLRREGHKSYERMIGMILDEMGATREQTLGGPF